MYLRKRFEQVADILSEVSQAKRPLDQILEYYFKSHKEMGGRDRKFVADTVYGMLRQYEVLAYATAHNSAITTKTLIALYWLRNSIAAEEDVTKHIDTVEWSAVQDALTRSTDSAPLSAKLCLPPWILERIYGDYSDAELLELAAALNSPAPFDVRFNSLKISEIQFEHELLKHNFVAEKGAYSPYCFQLAKKQNLTSTNIYLQGWVEIQDQGSQLISLVVEAQPTETVVDFCAGAGGKSLLLAETMHDQGKVIAMDTSAHRLERMTPRIARSGLSCIETHAIESENDLCLDQWQGKIDRVLVDAPCSGSGTLRRHPELKQQKIDVDLLQKQQISILSAAAKLVKTGGRLVYATCSLLTQENDEVVAAFLAQHREFCILPVNDILARLHIPLTMRDDTLKLLPHHHGTDGFFACAMQKSGQ